MHHHIDRTTHTTAFVTLVMEDWLEREIAQWVHPMKDRSDDPSHHERMLLPQSYISLSHMERTIQIATTTWAMFSISSKESFISTIHVDLIVKQKPSEISAK